MTGRARSAQVNTALGVLLLLTAATGVASWLVATGAARPLTFAHAVGGIGLLLLTRAKARGPVRTGLRSGRATRWVSVVFGVAVLATIALGVLHASGVWAGVGVGSALWLHLLLGVAVLPLALWHVRSRSVRLRRADLGRRAVLSGAALVGAASVVAVGQEWVVRRAGLPGARRGGTGSLDRSSLVPSGMPVVSWLDDAVPAGAGEGGWRLTIGGRATSPTELASRTRPLAAHLDCTGGWRSLQRWDVVPLSALLPDDADHSGRSVRVTSATGYSRLFARSDCDGVYLCTGYAGRPLAPGHGAPVRVVAPGRRGPWWVKWVTTVEVVDRPAWLQPPLPLT